MLYKIMSRTTKRRDKVRNYMIRREVVVGPILKMIEMQQFKVFGYLLRISDQRSEKKSWQSKVYAKECSRRLRKTWDEALGETLPERKITWKTIEA